MDKARLTREERSAIRRAASDALAALTPETAGEVADRLRPLVLPDARAEPGRTGLRVGREVIREVAAAVDEGVQDREALERLVESLWASGIEEARVAAAHCIGPLLPAQDEEGGAGSVERIRGCLSRSKAHVVGDALADTVSREFESGRGEPWMEAISAWCSEADPRLRAFGPAVLAHLFSRGKAPEKLFDALRIARELIADPDPQVRHAVVTLLLSGAKKQAPSVQRFLDKLQADDRKEVQAVAKEVRKRIRVR